MAGRIQAYLPGMRGGIQGHALLAAENNETEQDDVLLQLEMHEERGSGEKGGGEVQMTVFEVIKELDEEMMAEFLYRFARDTIDQFERFILPDKERIRKVLELEAPR